MANASTLILINASTKIATDTHGFVCYFLLPSAVSCKPKAVSDPRAKT
ncbi:hypothetical protein JW879_03000 [candidate division WOR-3 bacterium]|nr:hypothetical protein [candidate division WOR-3 bacterium]